MGKILLHFKKIQVVALAVIALLLGVELAYAGSKAFEIFDRRSKKIILCKQDKLKAWQPGETSVKTKKFVSYKKMIQDLTKMVSESPEPQPEVKKQLKALTKNLPAYERLCTKAGQALPDPRSTPKSGTTPKQTATPTGGGTKTPQKSPTAVATATKSSSGGNVTAGAQSWQSKCASCHASGSKSGRSASQITAAYSSIPQMIPFKSMVTSQEIANISAYLNSR